MSVIYVSILVVLEMVLKEFLIFAFSFFSFSFNPCCSGNGAESWFVLIWVGVIVSFNPCCSGNGAESFSFCFSFDYLPLVSILVVLEMVLKD